MAITSPLILAQVIDNIGVTSDEIISYARQNGLCVCREELFGQVDRLSVDHTGSWQECVDQARGAGASIIYVHADSADIDALLVPIAERAHLLVEESNGVVHYAYEDVGLDDEEDQDVRKVSMAIIDWLESKQSELSNELGELETLLVLWARDGITHTWSAIARRWEDRLTVIRAESDPLLAQFAQIYEAMPGYSASRHDGQARQLAEHPRFRDATSEAKRIYLASRLFDVDEQDARSIAERATLIHWYDIAPMQSKAQREAVQSLKNEGFSVRAIAQQLGITEAKVRSSFSDT